MVEFTKHAGEMLKERGFMRETVVDAILHPDWTEERSGEEWHALKRIGDKVLRVVFQRKSHLIGSSRCFMTGGLNHESSH